MTLGGINEEPKEAPAHSSVDGVYTREDPEAFVTIMKVANDKGETQIINSFSKSVEEAYEKLIQAKQVYEVRGITPEILGTYKKIQFNVVYHT